MDLREIQKRAWRNKTAKGFNTTDVAVEFALLEREVSEAFTEWYADEDPAAELADVLLFTVGLAEMISVDLDMAVTRKMHVNEHRIYTEAGKTDAMVRGFILDTGLPEPMQRVLFIPGPGEFDSHRCEDMFRDHAFEVPAALAERYEAVMRDLVAVMGELADIARSGEGRIA